MPRDRELEPSAWMERFFPARARAQTPSERASLAEAERDALLAFKAEGEAEPPPASAVEPAPTPKQPATYVVGEGPESHGSEWREPKRPLWLFAAAAIAVTAIGISSAGLIRSRDRGAAPDTHPGQVSINTRPEGAEVLIDGRHAGVTPLTVSVAPGGHLLTVRLDGSQREVPLTIAPGSQSAQYLDVAPSVPVATSGQIAVSSDPPGARVSIDGRSYGNSPMTASNLSTSKHTVSVTSNVGSAERVVTVEAGGTTSVVFSLRQPSASTAPGDGWLTLEAPFDVQVLERNTPIGSGNSGRIVLAPGRHTVSLVNRTLGYQESRTIDVSGGHLTTLHVAAPKAALSLNARPWANVTIDKTDAGQTPIANLLVPIGSHQVTFRHPELGERQQTIVVTATGPNRATADLTR